MKRQKIRTRKESSYKKKGLSKTSEYRSVVLFFFFQAENGIRDF